MISYILWIIIDKVGIKMYWNIFFKNFLNKSILVNKVEKI